MIGLAKFIFGISYFPYAIWAGDKQKWNFQIEDI